MVKVINPFFPEGIGCLKYKRHKNLKDNFTHIVLVDQHKKKKGGEQNERQERGFDPTDSAN